MNQVIEYHFPLMFTSALTKLSFLGGKKCFGLKIKSTSKLHLSVQVNLLILGVCVCVCVCVCGHSVYPTLCNTLDCSPPGSPSMGFFRQEYRSGLPFPPPGDLPDPELNLYRLHFRRFLYLLSHWARLILILTQ